MSLTSLTRLSMALSRFLNGVHYILIYCQLGTFGEIARLLPHLLANLPFLSPDLVVFAVFNNHQVPKQLI
ncbi:hypothetical protein DXX94_01205 [Thalassotalea euphylliae]|uniref:Uncharacterized protein n=1 Tax=Thalassotalea euphylliae TaxID=1655234 RepID=A0A3E0TXW2_9GAMM|nr:hypothetical protein DXX94_01205 [Thalassotalea euphylliae]